jgi:hypothetical protein
VLASAGAVERKRAMDRSLVDPFGLRDLLGVVRVEHDYQVEVAVADMAWCRFPVRVQRLVRKTALVNCSGCTRIRFMRFFGDADTAMTMRDTRPRFFASVDAGSGYCSRRMDPAMKANFGDPANESGVHYH